MEKKRRPRKKRKIRYMRIIIALIVVLGLVFAFLKSPLFRIRSINVEGNEKVDTMTLITASNLTTNDNYFFIDKDEIEKRISGVTFIESVKTKRSFLFKINIIVTEREPASTIQTASNYLLIDKYGYVIDESQSIMLNLLLIKGIENVDNIRIGDKIFDFATEEQNKLLTKIYDGERLYTFKSINLEDNKAEMVLKNDVFVAFGSYTNAEYKLQVLDQMILTIEEDTSKNASMILMEEGPNPILVLVYE